MYFYQVGTVAETEVDSAVFKVQSDMPSHLEAAQAVVAEIILGEKVYLGILGNEFVQFRKITVQIKFRLSVYLNAEVKSELWGEIEIICHRHAI